MSTLEIMVFAAPVMAVIVVISVGFFGAWLSARAERHRVQR
jgi:hypothetical protein